MNSSMGKSEFEEDLAILRETYFFSELPLETLKVLAYLSVHERFQTGDYLFHQDDDDGLAFYIISGEARLCRKEDGQSIVVKDFTPGAFFGGLALLGSSRRLFSLQAQTDMTCLVITRQKFSTALAQFPEIAPRVLQAVVNNIYAWEKGCLTDMNAGCEACRKQVGVSLL